MATSIIVVIEISRVRAKFSITSVFLKLEVIEKKKLRHFVKKEKEQEEAEEKIKAD
jgi:hypothetical protein